MSSHKSTRPNFLANRESAEPKDGKVKVAEAHKQHRLTHVQVQHGNPFACTRGPKLPGIGKLTSKKPITTLPKVSQNRTLKLTKPKAQLAR